MAFAVFAHLLSTLLNLLSLFVRSEREKDLEILLLRAAASHLATTPSLPTPTLLVGETATGHPGKQARPRGFELPCSPPPKSAALYSRDRPAVAPRVGATQVEVSSSASGGQAHRCGDTLFDRGRCRSSQYVLTTTRRIGTRSSMKRSFSLFE